MPRKKPTSGKARKEQLFRKRAAKAHNREAAAAAAAGAGIGDGNVSAGAGAGSGGGAARSDPVTGMHRVIPVDKHGAVADLHSVHARESDAAVAARKDASIIPLRRKLKDSGAPDLPDVPVARAPHILPFPSGLTTALAAAAGREAEARGGDTPTASATTSGRATGARDTDALEADAVTRDHSSAAKSGVADDDGTTSGAAGDSGTAAAGSMRAAAGAVAPAPLGRSAASVTHTRASRASYATREEEVFESWLRDIYDRYPREALNHFEHNIDVWRQLWHVLLDADVVCVVADVRNPMYHIHEALARHVYVDMGKPMVIALTKVDLVPVDVCAAWMVYLSRWLPGVACVPFSSSGAVLHGTTSLSHRRKALREALKSTQNPEEARRLDSVKAFLSAVGASHLFDAVRLARAEAMAAGKGAAAARHKGGAKKARAKRAAPLPRSGGRRGRGAGQTDADDVLADLAAIGITLGGSDSDDDDDTGGDIGGSGRDVNSGGAASTDAVGAGARAPESTPPGATVAHPLKVAMVGSPNVGKSFLINTMCGTKRVSVSHTAGHTKRAQTINVVPGLQLLDCPGIVFPALLVHPDRVAAGEDAAGDGGSGFGALGGPRTLSADAVAETDRERAIQECLGVLPLAQVRECYTAVGWLGSHYAVEQLYGLRMPADEVDSDGEAVWSSLLLAETYAVKRSYMIARVGRPDAHRGGREILTDAVDGVFPMWFVPPTQTPSPLVSPPLAGSAASSAPTDEGAAESSLTPTASGAGDAGALAMDGTGVGVDDATSDAEGTE